MTSPYKYPIHECQVADKDALHAFREKRVQWSNWLEDDHDHAIWRVLIALVWRDTAFAAISKLALENPEGPLNAALLGESIINGHIAMQVLALRRLTDRSSNVISLPRLIKDLKRHWHLLTRENLVCFDGLPYDYQAAMNEVWSHRKPGVYWGDTSGPKAYGTSELLHRQFDRLSGIEATNRSRSDVLPQSLLTRLKSWLLNSGVEEIAQWSHAYLAHAGNTQNREAIAHIQLTNNKVSAAIRDVARVAEALSAEILGIVGRRSALMPVPQYDVFEKLERPVASERQRDQAEDVWNAKSQEWDLALEDVRDALSPKDMDSH